MDFRFVTQPRALVVSARQGIGRMAKARITRLITAFKHNRAKTPSARLTYDRPALGIVIIQGTPLQKLFAFGGGNPAFPQLAGS